MPPKLALLTAAAAGLALAAAAPTAALAGTGFGPIQPLGGTTDAAWTSVAVNPAGDEAIGLSTYNTSSVSLTARRAGAAAFPSAQAPVTSAGQLTDPSIGPDGVAHAAYVEDGRLYVTSVAPGAVMPSAPQYVAGDSCCHSAVATSGERPEIATGADGATVVSWMFNGGSYFGARWAVRAAGARTFGPVGSTVEGRHVWEQSHLAADARGDAVIAWVQDDEDGAYAVHAISRAAGGSFGAPVTISAPDHHLEAPAVAVGPDGSAAIAWRVDHGDGSPGVIRIVSRAAASGAWTAAQTVSDATHDASLPKLAVGGAGGREVALAYVQALAQPVPFAALGTAGGAMGPPAQVSGLDASGVDVALGPDGTGILTLFDGSDTWSSIRPRGAAAFAFVDPATATADGQPARGNASVAFDAAGDALEAWAGLDGVERWRTFDGDPGAEAPPAQTPPAVAPATPPVSAPAPGAQAPATIPAVPGRPVLATAAATKTYKIPSLANLTTSAAKRKLRAAHLALGRITTPRRYRRIRGLVIRAQSRRAGTKTTRNARIDVTLGVKPSHKGR